MGEEPETTSWYRCVIDSRQIVNVRSGTVNPPVGSLFNITPPKQEIDSNTGALINPRVAYQPRAPTAKELHARTQPHYQPNEKVHLWIGFIQHREQRSSICFRLSVPDEVALAANVNDYIIGSGFSLRGKIYSDNLAKTSIANLVKYIAEDTEESICQQRDLPFIVLKTPKFDEVKGQLWRLTLKAENLYDTSTTENLMNQLDFSSDEPVNRAITVLRDLFGSSDPVSFEIWISDELMDPLFDAATKTFDRLRAERENGNVFRHFYTQRLQLTSEPHQVDTGSSLKEKNLRPKMTTRPQTSYSDIFEMTTRLAVAAIEGLEDSRAKVQLLNGTPANIRILRALGAGDLVYFGFLSGITDEVCLSPKDTLKINFRLMNNTPDEDWTFTVIQPFAWCVQGEVVGTLARPRVQHPTDATVVERKAFRPYQKTKLPVSHCLIKTMEDARVILERAVAVKCHVTLFASDKSESRIVRAMNIICNGSRPIAEKDRVPGGPTRQRSEDIHHWAQWLLMRDASYLSEDLIGNGLGSRFLSSLVDKDHVDAIKYLRNAPKILTGKVLAVIEGFAGSGKSYFLAMIVVAMLLDNPDAKLLLLSGANSAVDVIVGKVNQALATAKQNPEFAAVLGEKVAVRFYTDTAETSYILSLADKSYKEKLSRETAEAAAFAGASSLAAAIHPLPTEDTDLHPLVESSDDHEVPVASTSETEVTDNTDKAPIEDGTGEHVDSDEVETESEDDDYTGGASIRAPKLKKKKKSGKSKGKRRAEEVQKARANYLHDDTDKAIVLTDEDIAGDSNTLSFFGPLLANGAIDLDHSSIKPELKKYIAAVEMTESFNRQALPSHNGVRDSRFKEAEMSAAQQVLNLSNKEEDLRKFAALYQRFCEEGDTMEDEDHGRLKTELKLALARVKASASIVGVTTNGLGISSNQRGFGTKFFAVFMDEAGRSNNAEFLLAIANVDTDNILLCGDRNQFGPTPPNVTGAQGCTKELGMSIMEYLSRNHWPAATLYLQRRGPPGIGLLSSPMFYQDKMEDAPCTLVPGSHSKTAAYLKFYKELFPVCDSDKPVRFLDIYGKNELKDITGSYYNPNEAAVIVNILEKGIVEGVFKPEDCPIMTHYSAQQKVFRHAFAHLHHQYPTLGFNKILDYTTGTFQGCGGSMVFGSPVRTNTPGFTSDKGRNCVFMTRAEDFSVTVACAAGLNNSSGRGIPHMKSILFLARKKKVAIKIEADGPFKHLLTHRYVSPQVIGPEDNFLDIDNQQDVFIPMEEAEEDEQAIGDADPFTQASGGWAHYNAGAENSGSGGASSGGGWEESGSGGGSW